jgi:alanyl-tRNA synthetase
MQTDNLREQFLHFFESKSSRIVASDSLVPKGDASVLFTGAGMNQFKKQFLGEIGDYTRATTCQKCLRTDDLDKVGKTIGHHTFFEMLGNFSFGDYFKEEAITWAWEFLTKVLKIDKSKLWVSVYKEDVEAYNVWKSKIGIPEERIIKFGDKDNFWPSEAKEKGPNGPCGPCSEIFFDYGGKINYPDSVEVWNLVFTQFNRKEGGLLEPLPRKNIDTGMGLERLTAVMEGVRSNFETSLFTPILKAIGESASSSLGDSKASIMAYYAIADHIRAVAFCIVDGVMPSNEERGYVVRNLIRRALQHGRSIGINKSFLYKLIPAVSLVMKGPYPQLDKKREEIAQIVKAEEDKFAVMLKEVLPEYQRTIKDLVEQGKKEVPADVIFKYRDTHGLPWDTVESIAKESGLSINWQDVEVLLDEQRQRSRSQSKISDSIFAKEHSFKARGVFERALCESDSKVLDVLHKADDEKEVELVLDHTPFYAESGGQIGDTGVIKNESVIITINDTVKRGDSIVHCGTIKEGDIKAGDHVFACIDFERRMDTARNHTATHLLQAALRKVLGEHVQQQGSFVSYDRLRFDFMHFKAVEKEELDRVEDIVNTHIRSNDQVQTQELSLDEAKNSGALAFFAEKYADKVRVVSVGGYSSELCGGTHLESTGQIGLFKIVYEGSVAQGVRRIEAITGKAAYKKIKEDEAALDEITRMLKTSRDKAGEQIEKNLSLIKELERKLSCAQSQILNSSFENIAKEAQDINGIKFVYKILNGYDVNSLRKAIDLIKEKLPHSLSVCSSSNAGSGFLVIGLTSDLSASGLDASAIIKQVAPIIGGSGGGRKDFAQAGGNDFSRVSQAVDKIKSMIRDLK